MLQFVWRDMLMMIALRLVFVLSLLLLLIADPEKKHDEQDEPPGSISAAISWPEGDTDIDLWVMGPGEVAPIGYSNKGGRLWNLLRDDLGNSPDATPLNYEDAYTRGAPPGEYIVNVHCFRCPVVPQKVTVEIRSSKSDADAQKGTQVLFTSTLELKAQGQERTAARFRLDDSGNLVPGSITFLYTPLRSGYKSASLE